MSSRIDDGRRKMPKLKCLYRDRKVIDVLCRELKNSCELIKLNEIIECDMVLKCSHCGNIIGLRVHIFEIINEIQYIPIIR